MDMSDAQRLILSNQYKILSLLDTEKAEHYQRLQCVVEQGFGLQLNQLTGHFNALSEVECRTIVAIIEMHHAMAVSWANLSTRGNLAERQMTFHGFDGATESRYLNYVRFLIEVEGGYPQFASAPHGFDAQTPMWDKYQRMLSAWQRCPRQYHLSVNEITQILNA